MNCSKSMLILNLMIVCIVSVTAQGIQEDSTIQTVKKQKWLLSFSIGSVLVGTGNSLSNGMEALGLAEDERLVRSHWDYKTNRFIYTTTLTEYPQVSQKNTWKIATQYNFSDKIAISLSCGRTLDATANGYSVRGFLVPSEAGKIHKVKISHDVHTATADFILKSNAGFGGIAIGPVLAFHKVSEKFPTVMETKNISTGFHLGYKIPIVNKKYWFLGLEANYTWLPPTEIGPTTDQLAIASGSAFPGTSQSSTDDIKISLATLNFEITTGFKF